jgi:CelD/BcsL family acetyltransferase involved in cellulose biosynthesis
MPASKTKAMLSTGAKIAFDANPRHAYAAAAHALDVALAPDFDFGSAEFRSLQAQSQSTAFQAPGWLCAIHRDVVPALGAQAVTVTVRDGMTRRLLLVLPFVRVRRDGGMLLELADFGVSDYTAPIYRVADIERLVTDETLPQRLRALLPASDAISLTKLRKKDPILDHLFPQVRWARMRVSAYAVHARGEWRSWRLENIDRSLRGELDLKRRRFAKAGAAEFRTLQDNKDIEHAFDALRTFRAHRFERRSVHDVLKDEAVFSFYRKIAIEGAQRGTARTFCLYSSGAPVAVMFGLVFRDTFLLLLVGFDLMRYRRLSVGLLAIEDTVRASVEGSDLVYDFTIGDYPYKTQFGAQPSPLYECFVARTFRGRLVVARAELTREAKRRLKPFVVALRRSRLGLAARRLISHRQIEQATS